MKKSFILVLSFILLVSLLSACGDPVIGAPAGTDTSVTDEGVITLTGDGASFSCGGVSASGSIVTVSAGGSYTFTGTLNNGSIVVNTGEEALDVTLVLDNVSVTSTEGSAIYVENAKNVYLELADGSTNRLVSGTEADMAKVSDLTNGAAVFSEDDLKITGNGKLEVFGYINNGITCKDDLHVLGGNVSITAANNGLRGCESVKISGGTLDITAGNDGIKSTSATKEGKGYVLVEKGEVNVISGGDGISAETELTIAGGTLNVETTGDPELVSSKGLKAKTALSINGGVLSVIATDHAVHSTAGFEMTDGTVNLSSSLSKGIAAHELISVSGGELNIVSENDGIETPKDVSISGGVLYIISGGDGIYSGVKGNGFTAGTGILSVSGGTVTISAAGDPADAKGEMTVSGGTLIGTGTAKTIKSFSGSQPALACAVKGGADVNVNVLSSSLISAYPFTYVVFSAPELTSGSTYTVCAGTSEVSAVA